MVVVVVHGDGGRGDTGQANEIGTMSCKHVINVQNQIRAATIFMS